MSEDDWHQARLIPTSGISGPDEAERRATSALLAVMSAVREFGAAITKPLGAPAGQLETFIEVAFDIDDHRCIPDGLLRAHRGGKTWTYLVEVKTGTNELQPAQVESYLDVAKAEGFDGVLTISNQIAYAPGVHPTTVDKRMLRKAALHHLSWSEILATAVQQRVYRGVADPEQAWILSELIRYLEHPKSGALDFSDMSDSWTSVRDSVTNHTLRNSDKGLVEVVMRWEQLLRYRTADGTRAWCRCAGCSGTQGAGGTKRTCHTPVQRTRRAWKIVGECPGARSRRGLGDRRRSSSKSGERLG